MQTDSKGNVHVGAFSRASNGRVTVDFPAGDTTGVALDAAFAVPAAGLKLAVNKMGDSFYGQCTARLTAADLIAIGVGATPATIVPAMGANQITVVDSVEFYVQNAVNQVVFGATPKVVRGSGTTALTDALSATLGGTGAEFHNVRGIAIAANDYSAAVNKAIKLSCATNVATILGRVTAIAIGNAAGTGYAVGDKFSIGTTGAVGYVTSVNAGAVTGVEIFSAGTLAKPATNLATIHTTGSGDDALTITVSTVDYALNPMLLRVVTSFHTIDFAAL
jgi:hypothetical protein